MSDDVLYTELEVPDGVHEAEKAVEVLRAWIADGGLHVTFDPETFQDEVSEWGRLLADLAHHIAHAVELDGQMDREEALTAIRGAFDDGMTAAASDSLSGRIRGRVAH